MKLNDYEKNNIEIIQSVYESYINFDEYETKRVDCYLQDMFKDSSYTKQKEQVLVYIPKEISDKCTKVKFNNNYIVSFLDKHDNLLLSTYDYCIEDMIGLDQIKGFVLTNETRV